VLLAAPGCCNPFQKQALNFQLSEVVARHPAARVGSPAALQGVSLSIAAGEHMAVIGPSGAGKTSLLHVIACALRLDSGRLEVQGQSPWQLGNSALHQLRGRLFLAPQVPPLPPRQRVVTSVLAGRLPAMSLWSSLRSLCYPSDIPAAQHALAQFDLSDKLFERVDRLSGGERQRVGLARALLSPAQAWLVDEPLSALDPIRSKQALQTLIDNARARGVTLVASLHQVEMALAHFNRVVGLREGRVLFDLPAALVTAEHLARLYKQFEHELRGGPLQDLPVAALQADPVRPPLMHCR
jgi:phosphonate transport system ATP-binding protein